MDTEHTAPMDRSMEPKSSTMVIPEAIIISGAVSRSRFFRLISPRKFSWVRDSASSRMTMAEKLKYSIMLSRTAFFPGSAFFFVVMPLPPYIIRLTTSTWEGFPPAGASNSPVTRPSFIISSREHSPRYSSTVSPRRMTALPSSVISRMKA